MAMLAFLTTVVGGIVGLALLAVGVFWRSSGKTARLVIGIIGGVMAAGNLGLLVYLALTMATATSNH